MREPSTGARCLARSALAMALLLPLAALGQNSQCPRPIEIAASPIGRALTISANNDISGATRDFFDTVTRLSGCRFVYVVVPRVRAFAMLQAGTIDIVPATTRTAARDGWGSFVKTDAIKPMLISLRERKLAVHSVEQLINSKLNIEVVRGYEYGPGYDALISHPKMALRVQQSTDPDMVARKLAAGRMDAALLPPPTMVDAAEKFGLNDRLVFTELQGLDPIDSGLYLAPARLGANTTALLRRTIETLVAQGYVERLRHQYYATPPWANLGLVFFSNCKGGAAAPCAPDKKAEAP